MYVPTLVEVPPERPLTDYQKHDVPILDQGQEGACTGFGLATVVNYLLRSFKQADYRDRTPVSPRMLYEMARRYDEWPGEDYEGSSARGAMKGWHKHGVCSGEAWPYNVPPPKNDVLTAERSENARQRLLGAYFRVNHRDLVAMHSAICEAGVLYGTAEVHPGWDKVKADGIIPLENKIDGGHAFAIVAYDRAGLWIQNSWGDKWGRGGFARISYDDWLVNGTDVWVARLGVPVASQTGPGAAVLASAVSDNPAAYTHDDLRPHIISIGNNGELRTQGTFGSTAQSVREIFEHYIPELTARWKKKRILVHAHGGLVSEVSAIQRVADVREPLLAHEVYPLAFVWKSDFWTTLQNILRDALARRTVGGVLDTTKDFMLDRADDLLEPLARALTGKAQWSEMKENAEAATISARGGARYAAGLLAELARDPAVEIHLVGHSAGAVFHGPIVQLLTTKGKISNGPLKSLTGYGLKLSTLTLWAPACTVDYFNQYYAEALRSGRVADFGLFTLTDKAEQDDNCAEIYHKSLLYLVSNAFEKRFRIPLIRSDGERILGMEKFIRKDNALRALLDAKADWVLAPNAFPSGSPKASAARHHGDFDNDRATLEATVARILGRKTDAFSRFTHHRGPQSLRNQLQGMAVSGRALRVQEGL
jgi:Papain family cysteine protease